MPLMTKGWITFSLVAVSLVCTLIAILLYNLFHGAYDSGQFQVQQSDWSPSHRQLAMVARRSDHQALSGDQYFVLLGEHPFSAHDLKSAYYNHGVVFRAGSDCLSVQWIDTHDLLIRCTSKSIAADEIAVQQDQVEGVTISYEDIPAMSRH